MVALLCFVLAVMVSPFKSKILLEAENPVLSMLNNLFGLGIE